MEIFWICDGEHHDEGEAGVERRLEILSRMHEHFFDVPTSKCRIGSAE